MHGMTDKKILLLLESHGDSEKGEELEAEEYLALRNCKWHEGEGAGSGGVGRKKVCHGKATRLGRRIVWSTIAESVSCPRWGHLASR